VIEESQAQYEFRASQSVPRMSSGRVKSDEQELMGGRASLCFYVETSSREKRTGSKQSCRAESSTYNKAETNMNTYR
jgi:hypothetical protein